MLSIIVFWGMVLGAITLLVLGLLRRSTGLITAGAVSILVLGGYIGLVFLAARALFTPPTTDLRQYNKLMSKAGSSPLLDHFPRKIPADAHNVHMYFDPGALQASTMLQLRYTTTPAQIAALTAQFTPKAVEKMTGGDDDYLTLKPYFTTADKVPGSDNTGIGNFPPDFQILVLYRDPNDPADTAEPTYSGVAISKKRNEIVYWMED